MFDIVVAKYDTHSVGFNNNTLSSFQTCRIKIDDKYIICVSLYKWIIDPDKDKSNRGYYIATYSICEESESDKENMKNNLNDLKQNCDESFINNIVSGKNSDTKINIYKFSINCWRPVEKKGKKWNYIGDKPHKDDEPIVQRLLS